MKLSMRMLYNSSHRLNCQTNMFVLQVFKPLYWCSCWYDDTSKRNVLVVMWNHAHDEITSLRNEGIHVLIDEESVPRRAENLKML